MYDGLEEFDPNKIYAEGALVYIDMVLYVKHNGVFIKANTSGDNSEEHY